MMAAARAYTQVSTTNRVSTADPHQLITILFEEALADLARGRRAIEGGTSRPNRATSATPPRWSPRSTPALITKRAAKSRSVSRPSTPLSEPASCARARRTTRTSAALRPKPSPKSPAPGARSPEPHPSSPRSGDPTASEAHTRLLTRHPRASGYPASLRPPRTHPATRSALPTGRPGRDRHLPS